ncbi:MAG: efflux RND transporter periplasmic adaptor subunit [Planctomycetes bacterium]|nr:efflux RND transporter periplasmic adaptor subunit [Planctomycetota bacterium]
MAKAGIRLGKVVERQMSDSIMVNGEVDYDRTKFARVSSRVSGTATRIDRSLGDHVRAGEVLALIDSPEIGKAKAELLQALTVVEVTSQAATRLQVSSAAGFRTESDRLAAEGAAREAQVRLFNARQALSNLGLPAPAEGTTRESIAGLGLPEDIAKATPSASLFPLVAPFDGVVVTRSVVIGEVVDPTQPLFEIADTRVMWITTDVPQDESQRVALGQDLIFRPDGADGDTAAGQITWVSTAVDETTRTVKWRANVDNKDGLLRAHAFGRARIVVRATPNAIAVQNEAVQWEGCCHIVFVRLADDIFQTRKVRVGAKDAAFTEIIGGVLPGEVVVTTGSHVLKSEILKSNLGAGCCADE